MICMDTLTSAKNALAEEYHDAGTNARALSFVFPLTLCSTGYAMVWSLKMTRIDLRGARHAMAEIPGAEWQQVRTQHKVHQSMKLREDKVKMLSSSLS